MSTHLRRPRDRSTAAGDASARPTRRRSRGQAVVELAVILPVMVILLLAAADLARLFHSRITISSAARAGALEAAEHPTSFQAGQPCNVATNRVMCAVMNELGGSFVSVGTSDVTMACDPSPCAEALGNAVEVSVVAHFGLISPMLSMFTGGQAFDLTSTASAQVAVRPNIGGASPSPSSSPSPNPSAAPSPSPSASPGASVGPSPSPGVSPSTSPSPSPSPLCFEPVADFMVSPTSGKKKKTDFQFTDLSTTTAECPLTWSWNFGDGAGESPLQDPIHQYQASGVYTVTLVVSSMGGQDQATRNVTVTN
jgi:Flp pilus assembly protein TadG